MCAFCRDEVFSSGLYQLLAGSKDGENKDVVFCYNRSSSNLYNSVLENCNWCKTLVGGILTATDLDYWFDKWNGSHSDGSTLGDEGPNNDEYMDEEMHSELGDQGESIIDESSSMFSNNDREDEETQPGHELTLALSDFNDNAGDSLIKISFVYDSDLEAYTKIVVEVELQWESVETGSGFILPELKGENVVHLDLEVFSVAGKLKSLLTILCTFIVNTTKVHNSRLSSRPPRNRRAFPPNNTFSLPRGG